MEINAALREDYRNLAQAHGYVPSFPTSIADTIRELEQAQADGVLSAVGRDMLAELETISAADLQKTEAILDPTGYASFMDQVAESGCISPATLRRVFCAEFPTGDFNAWATATPNGYLCLLNHGLRNLLFRTSMAIWSAYGNDPDRASFEDSVAYVIEICGRYLEGVEGPPAKDVRHGSFALKAGGQIAGAMRLFVVSHEVAHVELGHLEDAIAEALPSPAGEIEVINKSMHQEFEADRLAQRVLTSWAIKKAPNRDGSGGSLLYTCGGLCFLTVEMIVSRVRSKLFRRPVRVSDTHPSSDRRIEALYRMLAEEISPMQIEQLRQIHSAFVRVYDVLDLLQPSS